MWLIRVEDEVLEYFLDERCPEYAILSHRWDMRNPEVSFDDMRNSEKASSMQNYQKTRQTCEIAAARGLGYVWIDTCCINKESSAELSEAINSMYQWYQGAAICYAYLVDVVYEPDDESLHSAISESEWFERGWTLQELIAPKQMEFLNSDWVTLGTKPFFVELLHRKTGIALKVLTGEKAPTTQSIAQRMSWASRRKITRVEDLAYCLLGIFDVNMPLLYGEGGKAFLRLQENILTSSIDHSIFAWPITRQPSPHGSLKNSAPLTTDFPLHGLLADSPAAFETCGNIQPKHVLGHPSAWTITNRGLSTDLNAILIAVDIYMVVLDCDDDHGMRKVSSGYPEDFRLMIFLARVNEDGYFARTILRQRMSIMRKRVGVVTGKLQQAYERTKMCIPLQSKQMLNQQTTFRRTLIDGFQLSPSDSWQPFRMGENWRCDVSMRNFKFMPPLWESSPIVDDPVVLIYVSNQHSSTVYMSLRFTHDGGLMCIIQTEAAFLHRPQLGHEYMPDTSDPQFWSKENHIDERGLNHFSGVGYNEVVNGTWKVKAAGARGVYGYLNHGTTNERLGHLQITRPEVYRGSKEDRWPWEVVFIVYDQQSWPRRAHKAFRRVLTRGS